MPFTFEIGDRVRYKNEVASEKVSDAELVGEVVDLISESDVLVHFDDGEEDVMHASELKKEDA
jgi:hypothetical protein